MQTHSVQHKGERAGGHGITALLGPTNTGKTHLAVERMLGHPSGMIGLPLRLLAREVYERIVSQIGPEAVSLITGEEKIFPSAPRYYVATVEAMPLDIDVDFLAIDEIQLASDFERGHVFTDRLLSARGQSETMLLGASTMKLSIEQLLPGTNFISRPRMSTLSYSGPKKLTRLARRSAVVAFSADRVYALAELLRSQRGGAAVVTGGLSPRTRNAQVELFQNGDVDFLVATDAIGMGLNMDVNHVSFAEKRKFDGIQYRDLAPPELAQIAGRAGRHMNDGTFGTSGDGDGFDSKIVELIENHRFDPIRRLQWRNTDLDYGSVQKLIESLSVSPSIETLQRTRRGDDFAALEYLARSDELVSMANSPAAVEILWRCCQLPDYRKIGIGEHAGIVTRIFSNLSQDQGVIPEDWLATQVNHADSIEGDIDTLANRISHIRTWTFVSNQSGWLADARHWQERTREVEDRLSDALHERLTNRFIDRRTSVLMRRLREKDALEAGVSDDGDVIVEGEYVGRLVGLCFQLDGSARAGADSKALQAAATKVMASELTQRGQLILAENDAAFILTDTGYLVWKGTSIARLEGGEAVLTPKVRLIADEELPNPERIKLSEKFDSWLAAHLRTNLSALFDIEADAKISGLARGIGFRLVENLGFLAREIVASDVRQLDQEARRHLRRHGVRFGAYTIFIPILIKPQLSALRVLLFKLFKEVGGGQHRDNWPDLPQAGLTSCAVDGGTSAEFLAVAGYRLCGRKAVRADMLERLGDTIRPLIGWKPGTNEESRPEGSHMSGGFVVTPLMMSLLGCSSEDMSAVLSDLGYQKRMLVAPRVVASMTPLASDDGENPRVSLPAMGAVEGMVKVANELSDSAITERDDPASPVEIEVWRPRPRQQKRAEQRDENAQRGRTALTDGSEKSARRDGETRKPRRRRNDRENTVKKISQPSPEIIIDEDSPFAALRAIKERMKNNGDYAS
jgi:ATP-dependent RNA helicase SUPV3L1/SUV3